jgi:HK97 gp10 family phage protein
MSVKVTGIDELSVKLVKCKDLTAVKKVVSTNGAAMTKQAKRNAPVDTGFLKRSITGHKEDSGLTAVSEASAEYAGYVEYGTRFQPAQHYMRDAWKTQGEKFKSDLEKLVK